LAIGRGDVLFELLCRCRADDDAGDFGFSQAPCERELCECHSCVGCERRDLLDSCEYVVGKEVFHEHACFFVGAARTGRGGLSGFVFACERALCEGRPDDRAHSFSRGNRKYFFFDVSGEKAVLRLIADGWIRVDRSCDVVRVSDLGSGPFGDSPVEDFSLFDEVVDRANGFFYWRVGVVPMKLKDVEVIESQSSQTCVNAFGNVFSAQSLIVR